jgi:iron complex transport system ATP-binding protein
MSGLAVKGITVRRAGRTVLDDLSLDLRGSGFTALIGANGAGKSTLLACLAGLSKPDRGVVTLDGHALAEFRPADLARRRAYLPQNPRCEWPISVERLVALGLTPVLPALGDLPAAMALQVTRALIACDLAERRAQPATTLSGGELARAMLARALVGEPEILIVDEPTTGLDPRHALDAMARLKAIAAEGRTVIAAIHDLTLVARHADRVVALAGGRLAADAPTEAALTPALLRAVFGVDGRLVATPDGPIVDLRPVDGFTRIEGGHTQSE